MGERRRFFDPLQSWSHCRCHNSEGSLLSLCNRELAEYDMAPRSHFSTVELPVEPTLASSPLGERYSLLQP